MPKELKSASTASSRALRSSQKSMTGPNTPVAVSSLASSTGVSAPASVAGSFRSHSSVSGSGSASRSRSSSMTMGSVSSASSAPSSPPSSPLSKIAPTSTSTVATNAEGSAFVSIQGSAFVSVPGSGFVSVPASIPASVQTSEPGYSPRTLAPAPPPSVLDSGPDPSQDTVSISASILPALHQSVLGAADAEALAEAEAESTTTALESRAGQRFPASAWSLQNDRVLQQARKEGKNWALIAALYFPHKSSNACRKRHERLVQRQVNDSWDDARFDALALAYCDVREQMWTGLAETVGENWRLVEEKCMEKGLRFLTQRQTQPGAGMMAEPVPETDDRTGSDESEPMMEDVVAAAPHIVSAVLDAVADRASGSSFNEADVAAATILASVSRMATTPETRQALAPAESVDEKTGTNPSVERQQRLSIQSFLRSD